MSKLRTLVIIAVIANLLTIILFSYAASQPGGSGQALAFVVIWMPLVWITTIIFAIIIAIRHRQKLFANRKWAAIITLLFCTPVPLFFIYQLAHPKEETRRSSTQFTTSNGKIYKIESWDYNTSNLQKYVVMYFSADSAFDYSKGENDFKKDSVWTYFTKAGDTLKVEKYKEGQLVSTKKYAEN